MMKKSIYFVLLIFLVIINQISAFSNEAVINDPVIIIMDSRAYSPSHEPHIENDAVYLATDDIFGVLRYEIIFSSPKNTATFLSSDNFFTVGYDDFATIRNGSSELEISWKRIDGRLYINVEDLPKLESVKVKLSKADGYEIIIESDFTSGMTVHNDDYLFSYVGSYYVVNGTMYISVHNLANIFPDSEIIFLIDGITFTGPAETSPTIFKYTGHVEYGKSKKTFVDPEILFKDAPGSLRKLINFEYVAKYAGFDISYHKIDGRYYLDILSKNYGVKKHTVTLFQNEEIPLGSPDGILHEFTDMHEPVRDAGYFINTKLMNEIAIGVNAHRSAYGLNELKINHMLMYAPQSGADPLRDNGFDNLRWCREYLDGRKLEHTPVGHAYSELMIANAKSDTSVARMIDSLHGSEGHRYVLLSPNVSEFGVAAIQYPNGDVDVALIFK